MSKQIEALELALEALETGKNHGIAIDALRRALAEQPAQQWNAGVPPLYPEPEPGVSFKVADEQPAPPPECQTEAEKTAFAFGWWKALEQKRKADSALDRMAENARELGLDYEPIVEQVEDSVGMGHGAWDMVEPKKLAKAFHEALAEQPAQQEPVLIGWDTKTDKPIYTTVSPRKPLTYVEIERLYYKCAKYQEEPMEVSGWQEFARAIEAAHGITGEQK